ncbi:hypothetical protein CEXT_744331 [Caerostris extrusa]|uniref:Uncharacterized protein n=1 Tax=Caerostris extrusa TaxID=172846 RepID=A0AAV4Y6T0_CAEEX|nr:hypothetical protein CEXT_744331 [Caerostris extrusa]
MASSKVSREKLKRSGSFQKKEPPPPPPDENQFPDVKLEDFEMLKTIGKISCIRPYMTFSLQSTGYFVFMVEFFMTLNKQFLGEETGMHTEKPNCFSQFVPF